MDYFGEPKRAYYALKRADADESLNLGNLNSFGQFSKNSVLYGEILNKDGEVLMQNTDYTEIERRIDFPRTGILEIKIEGRELILRSDTFARSVELRGQQGREFGWIFEDNYFDLFPGKEKRIRILGNGKKGVILIQPYYWEKTAAAALSLDAAAQAQCEGIDNK